MTLAGDVFLLALYLWGMLALFLVSGLALFLFGALERAWRRWRRRRKGNHYVQKRIRP